MSSSGELLAALVDAMPIGVVVWRVEHPTDGGKLRMVRPNTGASRASGIDLRPFIGQTMEEAFPPFAASGAPDEMLRVAFHGGETLELGRIEYADGNIEKGWYAASAYRLDDQHLVVQYRNVTEEEQLLRDLAVANAELERFAYFASHDLQAPVRQIMAFCELVREADVLDDDTRGYLGYAIDASERMGNLIRDLLNYARADRGPMRLVAVPVSTLLSAAVDDLQTLMAENQAEVVLPTTELQVLAPTGLGGMVLFNLLNNAMKFSRPGVAPRVVVRAVADGERVRVEVQDNGIGFDPERLDDVFTPFKRLVSNDDYAGSGLGLAFCKRVMARAGGALEGTGVPGEGSTFTVWFQRAPVS